MQKCFYLICPTDCLEPIINRTFKSYNFFYTSLGNSFVYDKKTIEYVKQMIKKHSIREIYFVLSMDNLIVLDALENHDFSDIRGLNNFYNEIRRQKKHSEVSWQANNLQFSILSYYLNKKINDFQLELNNLLTDHIKISGKIYNRPQDVFTDIYCDLVCIEKYYLN